MKVTCYMAISADGFVATKNGDSDWVSASDTPNFQAQMKQKGCIILGRRTYEQYTGDIYPVADVTNIVVTTQPQEVSEKNVFFVGGTPQDILKFAESKGHQEVLLIGGGKTNGLFFAAHLINEIILIVHPLILGDGIKLFETTQSAFVHLQLLESKQLSEGLVQLRYQVLH